MVELILSRAIAACESLLKGDALTLRMHEGHEDIREVLKCFGKLSTTPKMDPVWNDFTSENAFWLVLYDEEVPVAGLGARMEDLGRENVSDYWVRTNRRHYGSRRGVVEHTASGDLLSGFGGRLVYLGELTVSDRRRGNRNVLKRLLLAMHCLALLKWDADWHYAFLRGPDARVGMERCYHFTRMLPGFQRWENPPDGRDCTEFLATISKDEIKYLSELYGARTDWL
ncbi:MAG: hypothetical protein ABJO27_14175 [Pseudoruegeria sp.]